MAAKNGTPSESVDARNHVLQTNFVVSTRQLCPRPRPPQLKQIFSGALNSAAAFAMRPIIISFKS